MFILLLIRFIFIYFILLLIFISFNNLIINPDFFFIMYLLSNLNKIIKPESAKVILLVLFLKRLSFYLNNHLLIYCIIPLKSFIHPKFLYN